MTEIQWAVEAGTIFCTSSTRRNTARLFEQNKDALIIVTIKIDAKINYSYKK